MMGYTNRHFRYLLRFISQKIILFSEMVHANAVVNGNRHDFLDFHNHEHPVIFQLGGNDPSILANASKYIRQAGYDNVNLNCGCPSDRVQSGAFGVCLMRSPLLVKDCIKAMSDGFGQSVSVKCRIGVDDDDSFTFLQDFVGKTTDDGDCQQVIIHARKAILKGLSPAQNRNIPPLKPEYAYKIKQIFPHLDIIYNGGIQHISDIAPHEHHCDGTMIGRLAYQQPWSLSHIDDKELNPKDNKDIISELLAYYRDYANDINDDSYALNSALLHFMKGFDGAKAIRRQLTENGLKSLWQ